MCDQIYVHTITTYNACIMQRIADNMIQANGGGVRGTDPQIYFQYVTLSSAYPLTYGNFLHVRAQCKASPRTSLLSCSQLQTDSDNSCIDLKPLLTGSCKKQFLRSIRQLLFSRCWSNWRRIQQLGWKSLLKPCKRDSWWSEFMLA